MEVELEVELEVEVELESLWGGESDGGSDNGSRSSGWCDARPRSAWRHLVTPPKDMTPQSAGAETTQSGTMKGDRNREGGLSLFWRNN